VAAFPKGGMASANSSGSPRHAIILSCTCCSNVGCAPMYIGAHADDISLNLNHRNIFTSKRQRGLALNPLNRPVAYQFPTSRR